MAYENNYNRRLFLQQIALGGVASAFPGYLFARNYHATSRLSPDFQPDVELDMTARPAQIQILSEGPLTRVQKYGARLLKGPDDTVQQLKGNYLGPTFNFRKGQKVRVFFHNRLTEPSIVHWHGLHVPQKSDGHPMYSIPPGERFVYEFEVKNRAGTSFYHSHTHELTAEQVYKGLAGLIIVTDDDEQRLSLPSGEFDLPFVIQDRSFTGRNQLRYVHGMHGRMMGFLGETILVNGKPDAVFSVKSRAYRFRAVNGSNSRIYKLGWEDGTPMIAIGTDAGLLAKPETRPYFILAPGERIDLWLDFSGRPVGSRLTLYSLPFSGAMPPMAERMGKGQGGMGGMGMMGSSLAQGARFPIATFRVAEKISDSPSLPEKLVSLQRLKGDSVDNPDSPVPIAISMRPMAPLLNGRSFSLDRVMEMEKVSLGSFKKIRIFHDHAMKPDGDEAMQDSPGMKRGGMRGGMGMMGGGMRGGMGMMGGGMMLSMAHPIHLHGQQFQIISRTMTGMRQAEYATVRDGFIDSGWKDTVLVMPGEEIEIIKPFQDYKGLFLYHCHNLEHEDMGMMRQFFIQ